MATSDDIRAAVLQLQLDVGESAAQRRVQARQKQVEQGHLSLVPLPRDALRRFQSDLTVEKSSLFVSNGFPDDTFSREVSFRHPLTGESITQRLVVGRVENRKRGLGVLTQAHQDVFYGVLELWELQGKPAGKKIVPVGSEIRGVVECSLYELVMHLRANDGATHYKRVRQLVQEISAIPIDLYNYVDSEGEVVPHRPFRLWDARITERDVDRATGRGSAQGRMDVRIELSDFVTRNFVDQHVKQLLGAAYAALGSDKPGRRGEIARLLYPFLDAQLYKKDSYHATLSRLTAHFGFTTYAYRSKRREKFLPAVNALQGRLILGGDYRLEVSLEPTADGEDFKLVAKRVPVASSRSSRKPAI